MAKKKRRKKKQDSYAKIIGILIVLAAVAAAVSIFVQSRMPSKKYENLAAYFSIDSDCQIGLSIDGTVVKNGAHLIGDSVYFSYDDIVKYLNHRFYIDEAEGLLCVTTPTELRTIALDDLRAAADMVEEGGICYLSRAFVETWTDMETMVCEDPDYLAITTDFTYDTVVAGDKAKIRVRPTTKANILKDVPAGEVLRVLNKEDTGEGWTAVVSADGLSGYIQNDAVTAGAPAGADHVSKLGDYTAKTLDEKVNLVFYQTDNPSMNATLNDKLSRGVEGINVISPTWFFLDGPGAVTSNCDVDFVNICHQNGYQVWALLNDIDGACTKQSEVYEALKTTSSRQSIIGTMIDTVLSMGIDGINVDLERISEECAPAYLEFLRELSVECRRNDLFLSVDTYVPMNYSLYLNREEQGVVADYVIIMCYDEHFQGSEKAGSVASIDFMKTGIERSLREVPAHKLVAAVPFYTRLWITAGNGNVSSKLIDMGVAASYIESHNMTVFWDESVCQYVAELESEDGLEQIWVEDARSIGEKMNLVKANDLAGVAAWCLGNESPDVWPVIKEALS